MKTRCREYPDLARKSIEEKPGVRDAVIGATVASEENRQAAAVSVEFEQWRDWASSVKNHALSSLDDLLIEAEQQFTANGCTVHWATNAEAAQAIVTDTTKRAGVSSVVKGKSVQRGGSRTVRRKRRATSGTTGNNKKTSVYK